jgi:hypothetical protein
MKTFLTFIFIFVLFHFSYSQKVKVIAAYDNQNSYTSGLFAIQDTAVYRYSWYYNEWFALENTGLTRVNDTVKVSSLAVYNNKINNSSGIFVFSDSVVLNYNWFIQTWFTLSNTGLPRINNKPDVKMLTVYGDSGSSSNSTLFALTDTAIYRYNWFYHEWFSLSNSGLSSLVTEMTTDNKIEANAYPNPFEDEISITLNLPIGFNKKIKIAVFDEKGMLVKYIEQSNYIVGNTIILPELNSLSSGMYFCEIKAGEEIKTIRVIRKK